MLYGVPVANSTGGIFSNDVQWNSNLRGSVVYYTYMDGCPYIMGTLPQKAAPTNKVSTNASETGTGGDNAQTYGSANASSFSGGRETDYQPNDKVISSDGDAKLVLMGEGGAVLKASPMAQIIMGAGMDFIKMICRELDIFTDFGSLSFSHGSSGRTGLTIKGGAEYGNEAQAGAGTHTVFMQLGDTEDAPEMRFGVRVTSTDGGDFGALALGKDGRLLFTTSKDYLLMVGKDKHTLVDGDTYTELRGNNVEKISKNQKVDILQNEERNVTQKRTLTTGDEEKHSVGSNMDLQVGGMLNIGCAGLSLTSTGSGSGQPCELKCSSFNIVKA
jgi:hypothetical protein